MRVERVGAAKLRIETRPRVKSQKLLRAPFPRTLFPILEKALLMVLLY